MKSIIFFLFGIMALANLTFAQAPAPKPFKVTGTIKGNGQISKVNVNYGEEHVVVAVKNGRYSISGSISEPVIMRLNGAAKEGEPYLDYKENTYELYLVPGDVLLQSNKTLGNAQASGVGAKWNKDYQYLAKEVQKRTDILHQLTDECVNLNTNLVMYKRGKMESSNYGIREYAKDSIQFKKVSYLTNGGLDSALDNSILIPYLKKNPGSPVALWALMNLGGGRKNIIYNIQAPLFELLSPEVKALSYAKAYKEKIELKNITQIGKTAPVFTLPDTLGQSISLSSLRGQYVLVDFWADWCVPCRDEFPYLRKAYSKYKSKGFTILGVSISANTNKARWKEAIVKDEIHWLHMFDEKGEVAKKYSITAIPRNFLLDPKGTIIAVNLRGDAVEKKLKELLGE
jgi:peroxiredoxin